jgi:hypothetical protein
VNKKWFNEWAVDFNANETANVDFTRKNKDFPEIQIGHGSEIFINKTSIFT